MYLESVEKAGTSEHGGTGYDGRKSNRPVVQSTDTRLQANRLGCGLCLHDEISLRSQSGAPDLCRQLDCRQHHTTTRGAWCPGFAPFFCALSPVPQELSYTEL
jgi:anthranilate phosphoribosyltransferase